MHIENLVKMANNITAFFRAEPDHETAVRSITNHLRMFWDPRMRKQIVAHYRSGGEGLEELTAEAVKRLAEELDSFAQIGDG
jgi:formate dehydrogenase subunit delta